MRFQFSVLVDRPISDVFAWYADDHVRNHPRWDPDIELEKMTDGPIGLGTLIRRRNVRYGTPLEGTMEVVEYEPDKALGMVIREGGFEIPGRAIFEAVGPNQTSITISAEMPDSIDEGLISNRIQRSAENIKQLIESDLGQA